MDKYIKDVFKDFACSSNLQDAIVENVNLYKKQNRLQIDLISEKPITITEIGSFENYLQGRLKVGKTLTNIKYNNVQIEPDIESDWGSIVSYITSKEPLSRAMLTNSAVKIDNQKVDVNLKIKGAEFLCSKNFDKGLEHILQNIYNNKYSVRINDCLDDDYYAHIEKEIEEEEKKAIVKAEQEQEERIRQNQASLDNTIESQDFSENNQQSKKATCRNGRKYL